MELFATCPRALDSLVADELRNLGAHDVTAGRGGVAFTGDLETAYRAVIGSRVANRVLLPLARVEAPDPEALYQGVRTVRWRDHLSAQQTLAVDFTQIGSGITHTQYGAQKVKDAIVDQLRDETGERPSVDRFAPDVRINVHVDGTVATVAINLGGESLHRRGWRGPGAEAPLKENLAAAILLFAGWPARAAEGAPLIDPMCGSGTLLVEAALIAADRAPGLLRAPGGPGGWLGHDGALYQRLITEARARVKPIVSALRGFDADGRAVQLARENLRRADLDIAVEKQDLAALEAFGDKPGLVVTNPPYGERLGDEKALEPLYEQLGDVLKRRFPGWTGWVLTGNPALGKRIGLRAKQRIPVWNGPIECRLYELPISTEAPKDEPIWRKPRPPSPAAEMFKNRLAKNLKHLRKWAKREDVHCFRVYDADLPEYAVAVDLYEDAAHIQEYDAPDTVDPRAAEQRLHDVMQVAPEVLGVAPAQVFLKVRRRQRGLTQYEKQGQSGTEKIVRESGHRFLVNLSDYLDTGLFLDHRTLRQKLGEMSQGKRFLNLFAYTCTATVYAALGGARSSLSVDLSNTYLDWATRNFELNGVDPRVHELERADVLDWISRARGAYDLIFCAPPTFSRSKSMSGDFDVQRDHVALITSCARLLAPSGTLVFSNNRRKFKMDTASLALAPLRIEDWSRRTLPEDFRGNPRIHNTWRITRAELSPLTIRSLALRNRVVVSPMCQYSSEDGFANDWHLVHLGGFARGGASLVFTEATAVSAEGRISPQDLGLWKDAHGEMLARIVRFVKSQGAAAGIQLAHAGRKASTLRPWEGRGPVTAAHGGWQPIAPSALPFSEGDLVPKAAEARDLEKIVADFRAAARRARDLGFDVIELHAAHGYLLHEFLSPLSNQRTDAYGGSFDHRIRLVREVVAAIRQEWTGVLFVRISATDWADGGWDVDQSVALAKILKQDGVDLIDCSSGALVSYAKIPVGPGFQVPFATRIRAEAGIATGAVGMITEPAQADRIIRDEQADLVLLARQLLRDPHFALHAAAALGQEVAWPKQYERARP